MSTRMERDMLLAEGEPVSPPAEDSSSLSGAEGMGGGAETAGASSLPASPKGKTVTPGRSADREITSVSLAQPKRISKAMEVPMSPPALGRVLITSPARFRRSMSSPSSRSKESRE